MLKRLFSRRKGAEHEAQCLPPVYEHIYPPFYNVHAELDGREPELYDRNGRRIHVFFIRDKASVHASSQLGHHILWDKYNFGLKTHFYTHDCMLELMGKPVHRYGALVETRGIWPDYYTIFEKNAGLEQDFDKIFSYDESILDSVSNACFVPFCATIKLDFARISDLEASRRLMDDEAYRKKTRNVSILSSGKTMCELHMLRIKAARYLKERGLADAYGTFDGGPYVRAFDTLKDYRYSFVFENERSAYCFTEKLTNCFATQTVPIYLGRRRSRSSSIRTASSESSRMTLTVWKRSYDDAQCRIMRRERTPSLTIIGERTPFSTSKILCMKPILRTCLGHEEAASLHQERGAEKRPSERAASVFQKTLFGNQLRAQRWTRIFTPAANWKNWD